jgi:hypothetical protein
MLGAMVRGRGAALRHHHRDGLRVRLESKRAGIERSRIMTVKGMMMIMMMMIMMMMMMSNSSVISCLCSLLLRTEIRPGPGDNLKFWRCGCGRGKGVGGVWGGVSMDVLRAEDLQPSLLPQSPGCSRLPWAQVHPALGANSAGCVKVRVGMSAACSASMPRSLLLRDAEEPPTRQMRSWDTDIIAACRSGGEDVAVLRRISCRGWNKCEKIGKNIICSGGVLVV